jgi:glycerophosphoryl diester phosphodiesterase
MDKQMWIEVTGHRGAADLAPENTLAGFRLALALGCHAVELDVQLTKEGRLAVIHDARLERATNGTGLVSDRTLAELKLLDAGKGERIPSLEEVIDLLRGSGMRLQIELKGEATEREAPRVVAKAGVTAQVRFTSAVHARVLEAKRSLPEVETGLLNGRAPADPLGLLESFKADCLHVNHDAIDQRLVKLVHGAGKKIIASGRIVEIPAIVRLIDLGVDVIGSDRPDMVIDRLKAASRYRPRS